MPRPTDHRLDESNVQATVKAGRCRWKIENENNNTLKTKGYRFEHNFGHGKQYLASVLATARLLAYLFHTVLRDAIHIHPTLAEVVQSAVAALEE
jgi:hypothetical protein